MTDVVIIGGGHVGRTLLADLIATQELHGKAPCLLLFRSDEGEVERRVLEITGDMLLEEVLSGARTEVEIGREHVCGLESAKGLAALSTASIIFVTVPDVPTMRFAIFEKMAEHIDLDGKTIVLVKAGQASQPVIANMIRNQHPLAAADLIFAESFYGTRVEERYIRCKRKLSVNVAITSRDPETALRKFRSLFPLGERIGKKSWPDFPAQSGMELMFSATAYFLHVGVLLWPRNFALTEQGVRYNHFIEGIDKPLARKLGAIDRERVELGRAYGVEIDSFPQTLNRQYGLPILPDFYDMMQSCRDVYTSRSPASVIDMLASRHIIEDVPALYTIQWLMDRAKIEMPVTKAFVKSTNEMLLQIGVDLEGMNKHGLLLAEIEGGPNEIADLLNAPHREVNPRYQVMSR